MSDDLLTAAVLQGPSAAQSSLQLPGKFPRRGLLLPLQRGDALFDRRYLLLQALQVLLEPGDLFLLGPEAWPKGEMLTAAAAAAAMPVMAAFVMASMPATMVPLRFTTHDITSLAS
jgi:hypothetical protein